MTDEKIRGRDRIADASGLSPDTITRLHQRGLIDLRKCGPYENSPVEATVDEIERVRRLYRREGE